MTITASARAAQLNATSTGFFRLTEDSDHWAAYGVHTGAELDRHLLVAEHYDLYKDVHGIRPRWVDYPSLTDAEIQARIDRLYAQAAAEAERFRAEAEWVQAELERYEAEWHLAELAESDAADPTAELYRLQDQLSGIR